MINYSKRMGLLVTAAILGMTGQALAATTLSVAVNGSRYMEASGITRLAVGNPEIADVRLLSGNDFLLVGKKPGSTTLLVWSDNGREEYNVFVSGSDVGTAQAIQEAIGYPEVQVQMMNGKVLLRGRVQNQYEHDSAIKVAQMYLGSGGGSTSTAQAGGKEGTAAQGGSTDSNIIDMLDMTEPTQVRLVAQIIEINTSAEKDLGIQYWSPTLGDNTTGDSNSSDITRGTPGLFYAGENFYKQRGSFGWFGSHLSNLNASLQALVTSGKARILSRPSITTMSGQKAKILIGGRIPIPTSAGDGQIAIDWRDYGVKLDIEPVVDADNKITSKVHAEVSTLDYGHSVKENDFSIPAIASREAEAMINVRSGMTMAIGGLLNSEDSKSVSKIPLLGDIPIIGQFFRHTSTTRDNRELLILITPLLVGDDSPVSMSQRMKENYEASERYERNAEKVDVNTPVKPGNDKQERDIWGGRPEEHPDTEILEEKKAPEPPSRLLKTTDEKGETVLVPLSEDDYQLRKENLKVVGIEKPNGEIQLDEPEAREAENKGRNTGKEPLLVEKKKPEPRRTTSFRERVRKLQQEYRDQWQNPTRP
ncbi:type II and III secretion system protein family protein [uncultured Acidaminococcus sp.]|uniref:type II and III secretion system protein family protein n=1 Tax=uncultured Acidaminococcus sp. TaxID=352152 RepID=UPI00266F8F4F|nr:pilus assembly protein N-terminal domain-containing protein [uncultured Acidaminococcus sp.]